MSIFPRSEVIAVRFGCKFDAFDQHRSSSTLRKAAIEAFVLNGIIFLGSVIALETLYDHPHHHFLGCPYRVSYHYLQAMERIFDIEY